uniref:Aminotransferase-like plant mobile domain-containing protein n=1 Tax=Fagus sylvatica TaxID=28930 RepID=A0A2N9EBK2_FAGSY
MFRHSGSRGHNSDSSLSNAAVMDLYPVDDRFTLNRWTPQLAFGEDITIIFRPEEHLSYRARNGEAEGRAPLSGLHAPHREWRAPIRVSLFKLRGVHSLLSGVLSFTTGVPRSFMFRGNPTEPTDSFKKTLLCALVERWWDTIHTFHISSVEMTIMPYDVYRLSGLRIDGIIPIFSAFPACLRPNREYLSVDLGVTSANLPNLLSAFSEAPQTIVEEATRMAWAFLLYLIGTTLNYNISQTIPVRWLHLLVNFQQTAQYNWGVVALANLYAGFDAISRAATTSFVGIERVGSVVADKRAYSLAQFSRLFEGSGVRAFYVSKTVTRQLGEDEDLVPMPPLQFTLFPYKVPDEVILLWRLGILLLDRLDEEGDFEEYQQSFMPTLFPPLMLTPWVQQDIILPSWSVPLYQVDGSLHETTITRYTNVLGFPVPEDASLATHADLNYMFQLCGNMKTMMMDLSRDRLFRPPRSSSRGAQADLDATEDDNDDDDGAPVA